MDETNKALDWLKRSRSALILGGSTQFDTKEFWDEIYYEDLCYYLQ